MKKLLLALLFLLAPDAVRAQEAQTNVYVGVLRYDLDSTSTIYCKGAEGFIRGPGSVTNSGTTLTCDNSTGCFSPIAAGTGSIALGDALILGGGNVMNMVAAKATDNSIT